jgi:hypothetical protein
MGMAPMAQIKLDCLSGRKNSHHGGCRSNNRTSKRGIILAHMERASRFRKPGEENIFKQGLEQQGDSPAENLETPPNAR